MASSKSGSMKDTTTTAGGGILDGLVAMNGNLDGDLMVSKSTQLMRQKFNKPQEGQNIRNISRRDVLKQEISLLDLKTSILTRSVNNNNNERDNNDVDISSCCLPFDVVDAHRTFVESMRQSSMMRREFKSMNNKNMTTSNEDIVALSPEKISPPKRNQEKQRTANKALSERVLIKKISKSTIQQQPHDRDNIVLSSDDDCDKDNNNNNMIVSKRSMIMKSNSKRITTQQPDITTSSSKALEILNNHSSKLSAESTALLSNLFSSSPKRTPKREISKRRMYTTSQSSSNVTTTSSLDHDERITPKKTTSYITPTPTTFALNDEALPHQKIKLPFSRTTSIGPSKNNALQNDKKATQKYDESSSKKSSEARVRRTTSSTGSSTSSNLLKNNSSQKNTDNNTKGLSKYDDESSPNYRKNVRRISSSSTGSSTNPSIKNPYHDNDDNDYTKTPKPLRDSNHESISKSVTKYKSPNGNQSDGGCNNDDYTKTPKSILRDSNHESISSKKSITKYKSPNGRSEVTRRRSKDERPLNEDEIHFDPKNMNHHPHHNDDDNTTKTPRKSSGDTTASNRDANNNKLPKYKSPNGRSQQQEQRNRLMKDIKVLEQQQDEIHFDPASMTAPTRAMSDDIDNIDIAGSLRKKNHKSKSRTLSLDDQTYYKPNEMKLLSCSPYLLETKIKSQPRSRTVVLSDADNNDNEKQMKKDVIENSDVKKQKSFKKSQQQQQQQEQSTSLSKRFAAENSNKKKSIDNETCSKSTASISTTKSAKSKRSVGGGLDSNKSKSTTMLMVIPSLRKQSMSPSRRELSPGRNTSKSSQNNKTSDSVVRKVHSCRPFSNAGSDRNVILMNDDDDEDNNNNNNNQVGNSNNTYTDYDDDDFDPTEWNPTDDNQNEELSEAFYLE